eukprot:TRINITY_DN5312_c0_g1_i1.p1 TRINITY_DN5312_c0_g1~~TRINITY_DN5312_c0_g1_i1.p1  ORF type:complete len:3109 (+),score=985.10 TRINITY_DN5312_c0_g1_i1:86-9412(+)
MKVAGVAAFAAAVAADRGAEELATKYAIQNPSRFHCSPDYDSLSEAECRTAASRLNFAYKTHNWEKAFYGCGRANSGWYIPSPWAWEWEKHGAHVFWNRGGSKRKKDDDYYLICKEKPPPTAAPTASPTAFPTNSFSVPAGFEKIGVGVCKRDGKNFDGYSKTVSSIDQCASICSQLDECLGVSLCQSQGPLTCLLEMADGAQQPPGTSAVRDNSASYTSATNWPDGSDPEPNNYKCECFSKVGPQVVSCAMSPCQRGTCAAARANYRTGVAFRCVGPSCDGFSGERCEKAVDECSETRSNEWPYPTTPRTNPCGDQSSDIAKAGGRCVDLLNGYVCMCDTKAVNGVQVYEGEHCEVNVDDCVGNRCILDRVDASTSPHGCVDSYGEYICKCTAGWAGKDCEHDINSCKPHPCENGGICTDLPGAGGYSCTCPDGYVGSRCETDVNECDPNPCHAAGTDTAGCIDKVNDFVCVCKSGWKGKTCQVNVDACAPNNPCVNGGVCTDLASGHGFSCDCGDPAKWTGELCEINADNCAGVTCSGHGVCYDSTTSIGTRSCVCEPGYSGADCETDVDDCASNPCKNGACTDLVNSYKCTCTAGWEGDNCDRDINACASGPCVDGKCVDKAAPDTGYTCECFAGRYGAKCENVLNACTQTLANGQAADRTEDPCGDSGACWDLGFGKYTCRCQEGWEPSGSASDDCDSTCDCATNIDGCAVYSKNNGKGPCRNGGTCADVALPAQRDADSGLMYTCTCAVGYTGHRCEQDVDVCSTDASSLAPKPSPCQNGGECRDGRGGTSYTCDCLPGYTGDNCETDVNECEQNPCANGGKCVDLVNAYQCECGGTGYSGRHCTVDIDMCHGQCGVNGHCIDLAGGAAKDYECSCRDGYKGSTCHREEGGACVAWDACDVDIDDCAGNPCSADHTEGACIDLVDDYQCVCKRGWHGKNCELSVQVCPVFGAGEDPSAPKNAAGDANPCRNGGICSKRELHGADPTDLTLFDCECPRSADGSRALWAGKMCEEKVDDCSLTIQIGNNARLPCHGDSGSRRGHCHDKVGTHTCSCFAGYTGANCEQEIDECTQKKAADGTIQQIQNPCQNGGVCVDKLNGFRCTCADGVWSGSVCEVDVDACNVDPSQGKPCAPHGTCVDKKAAAGYTCTCDAGYYGSECELELDECKEALSGGSPSGIDNPCKNGGQCADAVNGFKCSCPAGWEGETCEVEEDGCAGGPCMNAGTCKDHAGTRYSERTCPVDDASRSSLEDCFPRGSSVTEQMCRDIDCCWHPWDNGGQIGGSATPWCYKAKQAQPAYTCDCAEGYSGANCETNTDDCASNPCGAHGTCYDLSPAKAPWFQCVCAQGWSGTLCDQDVDECTQVRAADGTLKARANPCGAHGTCVQGAPGTFSCTCNNGWEGAFCQRDVDGCAGVQCQNGGHCADVKAADLGASDPATKYVCKCQRDFHGDHCETQYDDCLNACNEPGTDTTAAIGKNGCVDRVRDFDCVCKSGWRGKRCDSNINACAPSNPCLNGGVCSDLQQGLGFTCDCGDPTKWAGEVCSINVDNCAGVSCSNHGTCYDLTDPADIGKRRCECLPGWEGVDCETNTDDCKPDSCNGHGTCNDLVNGYSCTCQAGYDGASCEVDVDGCAGANPCGDHGNCEDIPAADFKADGPAYVCRCHAGYRSDCMGSQTCEVSEKDGRHSGPDCNVDIDECETFPCANGICVNLINRYECDCRGTGFSGEHCEVEIDECARNPCQNGGVCSDLPAPQGYECDCSGTGFEGIGTGRAATHCDVKSIECERDGIASCGAVGVSRCHELVNAYACECDSGYIVQRVGGVEKCVEVNECEEAAVDGKLVPADPCNGNGDTCIDKIDGYECVCNAAYTGEVCDVEVDECTHIKQADGSLEDKPNPCQNEGTCKDAVGGYACECNQFWQGHHCTIPKECGRAGQDVCESGGSTADESLCLSEFVPSADRKKCVECGARGQPACRDGCDAGSVLNKDTGLCDACGDHGMLACCEGCHEGCLDIHKCTAGNAFDHSDGRCYECGGAGQLHCLGPDGISKQCDPGAAKTNGNDRCVACGGHNQATCATKDPCLKHTVEITGTDGKKKCWNCGREGQPACRGDFCAEGTILEEKAGSKICRSCGERGQKVCCAGASCVRTSSRRGYALQSQVISPCAGTLVVSDGRCVDCGASGQPPCPGGVCREGLQSVSAKNGGEMCVLCGRHDQAPCPATGCVSGTVADSSYKPVRCRQCGGRLMPPCESAPTCRTGLGALPSATSSLIKCRVCGGRSQRPCPADATSPGCEAGTVVSSSNWCVQCGDHAQAACSNGQCNAGTINKGGRCSKCGGRDLPPCSNGCSSGLVAAGSKCKPCGGLSQPPCGSSCRSGMVLSRGVCRDCQGSECKAGSSGGCGGDKQVSCQGHKSSSCNRFNQAKKSGQTAEQYWVWVKNPSRRWWQFWKARYIKVQRTRYVPTFTCFECGSDGAPVCTQWGVPCRTGGAVKLVAHHGTCRACGQHRQPPCAGGKCNSGLSAQDGVCKPCGLDEQVPCPGNVCSAGAWHQPRDGKCRECGGNRQYPCTLGGPRCRPGTVETGGMCHACGRQGQSPCISTSKGGSVSGIVGRRSSSTTDVHVCSDGLGFVHEPATGERVCQTCGRYGQAHCRVNTPTVLKHTGKVCDAKWRYVGDDPNTETVFATEGECRQIASANPGCGDFIMYKKSQTGGIAATFAGFIGRFFPQTAFGFVQKQGSCICTPSVPTGELSECDPRNPPALFRKYVRATQHWDTYARQQCKDRHNVALDGTCEPCGGIGEEVCHAQASADECARGLYADRTEDVNAPSASSTRAATCAPCGGRMQQPCPTYSARPGCRAGLESLTTRDPPVCEICGGRGQPACGTGAYVAGTTARRASTTSTQAPHMCTQSGTTPYQVSGVGSQTMHVCVLCGGHNQVACDTAANTLTQSCKAGDAGCSQCADGMKMSDSTEVRRCYDENLFQEWQDTGKYEDYTPMMKDNVLKGMNYATGKDGEGDSSSSGSGGVLGGIIGAVVGLCVGAGAGIAFAKQRRSRRSGSEAPEAQMMSVGDQDPSSSISQYVADRPRSPRSPGKPGVGFGSSPSKKDVCDV